MDIQKYQAFLRAVELGSFSAAAEEMGYTPSGVSHMADAIENETDMVLLRRGRSGVTLTAAGEALLPSIRELVRANAGLQQRVEELRGISSGKVTIGAYSSIAAQWLPPVLQAFRQDFPKVEIQLLEGVHQELDDWLANYQVDFCLYSDQKNQSYQWIPLRQDQMLVVLPPDHPLAGLSAIQPKACNGQPFIMPARGRDCDVVQLLEEDGIRPDIQFSTIENYAALSMIECGLGISIMNELITKGRTNHVAMLPFDPPRYITLGIAVPSLESASPAARKMIEYICKHLASG